MAVFTDLASLPQFRKAVLTIGSFDGVHVGHRRILSQVVDRAKASGGESVLLTFEPHPRKVVAPDKPLGLLTPLSEKLRLIAEAGIEHTVVIPFSQEFSEQDPAAYVTDFLVPRFRPTTLVIGYDHRFGRGRAGDIQLLRSLASQHGFSVEEIPAHLIDEAAVSSTKIRTALIEGRAADAAAMLGRPYAWSGRVVKGRQLGRTLGYPTANLEALDADQLLPGDGVYAVEAMADGAAHPSMLSIGLRPTIGAGLARTVEVHLLDFAGDLYGTTATLRFLHWMRGEEKFSSLDELKAAIAADEEHARKIFSPGARLQVD